MMTYTTTPKALTEGLEQMMGWMKKLHVPVHELAMIMSIALRFVPILIEELDKIIEETPIPEEDKETIKDIIEDMKEQLDKAETNEEKMDIIKDASNDLQFEVEKNEHNKEEIVDNLKQESEKLDPVEKENLKDLADAIEKGDREEINEALDKIYEDIMSNPDAESR
jgi:chemotaxis protein histidine kinase CheA